MFVNTRRLAMTTHFKRRAALTFNALLLAGMTLGAPVASAASLPQAPVAHRLVLPKAQFHEVYQVAVPYSPDVPSQIDNPLADMHQE
jgi:hypothetical protein